VYLEYVRSQELTKTIAVNNGKTDGINSEEPTETFIKFRDNHLFGAETSRNVIHIARINTLMNGAQYADLKLIDSLSPIGSITGEITHGLPEYPGFYLGGLTMILTNPPFGSVLNNQRAIEDFASRDGVTKRLGKAVKSIPQEIAFLNRCLEYLAPGGKLASVVPDGVLANSSMEYVRDWILRWARLKAIISLPQATFAPYGAGVKTSVVVLEKREAPLPISSSASKKTPITKKAKNERLPMLEFERKVEVTPDQIQNIVTIAQADDYEVYMARIDNIGYDARGWSTGGDEVQDVLADFYSRTGQE
jgi:type I restriction enzyme M protein